MSKVWFKHALQQLESVTSEHFTEIMLLYWLGKEEKHSDEFWKELDDILSKKIFKSILRVTIGCSYRDSNFQWHRSAHFDHSELPFLLPKSYKKVVW